MNRIVATMAILVDAGVCTHSQNLPARDRGEQEKMTANSMIGARSSIKDWRASHATIRMAAAAKVATRGVGALPEAHRPIWKSC
jgi:hypothetical protein